jgi:hypothetical protein
MGKAVAWFRYYEELNDFLPLTMRNKSFPYSFNGRPSIKDAIESHGVPHVEVDLILVNSRSVNFSYKLKDEDKISVFPVFESFDITPVTRLRAKPLRELKFIADVHLGKLTRFLRLCGFNVHYLRNATNKEIINHSVNEKMVILTRDIELLKNKKVTHGYWVRSQKPTEQLKEILIRFDLEKQIKLFTRCMECNGLLQEVSKREIIKRLQPKTIEYYEEFRECSGCKRIYWEGSHYERMKNSVENIIKSLN